VGGVKVTRCVSSKQTMQEGTTADVQDGRSLANKVDGSSMRIHKSYRPAGL